MQHKEISQAVIGRLPRYYRYLRELKEAGRLRISSQELSDIMKVTASQIRQDFNNFGGFGQQGYGYNVEFLYEEIGKILGMDREHHMIIVGAGNIGQALVGYSNFEKNRFIFDCAFDVDPKLFGSGDVKVPVYPVSDLESRLKKKNADIAVIATPKAYAQELATRLVACGIKAIWNFAPVDLEVPADVIVENVHLQDSLMKLSYSTTNHEESQG